jgi:hypothetical protein
MIIKKTTFAQKIRMKKIIISFTLVLFSIVSNAQQKYVWDEYGISFTLADDFEETTNTIEEFSAVGDGMELSIIPFKDETIEDSDIVTYTMSIAASLKFEKIEAISTININGFKGGYAEGVSEGVKIFIMGLIDPKSDTNFFVIITFQEDDENATEEAINICKGIRRL